MEEKASPDVKQAYNAKEYLENLYVAVQGSSDSTYPGLGPVIDAMEDAVIRCRYLVGGSDSFYDVYCVSYWLVGQTNLLLKPLYD